MALTTVFRHAFVQRKRPHLSAMPSTNQIRQQFLDFFKAKGHEIVPSSPLVPGNDPTLLFTNAGMVQFKDVFLGAEKRSYVRAVSSQRCVRAGGKHNDLDSVGYTARHHTFFEMLGNFSFGDYFKRDAIAYAWELLTGVYGLPADKLWVTVYHTDDEAFDLWKDMVGVPAERIVRIGDNKGGPFASDNFWQMGDTGPCGPCTEIFYDHGADIFGGPPGSPDEDGDRYIEIWNLVFMQFERHADGRMTPLPKPCVDTGMGLERLAAVLQHVHTNYETDQFQHLIKAAAQLTGTADLENKSLRVIADHIRACSFLIVDGVLPGNEGRSYVLRRIIRRALRHGHQLGCRELFFHRMVAPLIDVMGDAYPELAKKRALVEQALKTEEERFAETLENGMKLLESALKDDTQYVGAAVSNRVVPGRVVFTLYDTYGFPADLTADVARERGWTVDTAGFESEMEQQRARARAAGQFTAKGQISSELIQNLAPTDFLGYETSEAGGLRILAIVCEGREVPLIADGEEGTIILDRTPFYAESGGQVGDIGELAVYQDGDIGISGRFDVVDTVKLAGAFHGHSGRVRSGVLKKGDVVSAAIDVRRRKSTVLNHTATHLLHAALRTVLGEHVQQKGSLVAPDRLRFDFSHFQPVSHAELARIEAMVNTEIRANHVADIRQMGMQEALDFGAMALFGEKYGERVRVLKLGEFSTELCGGTHVERTGDIGLFRIVSEGGVASGVRRIEAVTGEAALTLVEQQQARLDQAAGLLGGRSDEVVDKLRGLIEKQRQTEKELDALKSKQAASAAGDLAAQAVDVGGLKVLAAVLDGADAKALRDGVDRLKNQLGDAVIVLAGRADGKVQLVAGSHGAALGRVKAGELLGHVAAQIGGRGGGRPDMAQGGGEDSPALDAALKAVPDWVRQRSA
jgi:alanyl-tRNA synthetase